MNHSSLAELVHEKGLKKTIKKEASNVNPKGANALDMRLHLVEKDIERLYKNVIEMQKDLKRVLNRMGL